MSSKKKHQCTPVVAETEEMLDVTGENWVTVSVEYECAICGKPMDAPPLEPNALLRAFDKLRIL